MNALFVRVAGWFDRLRLVEDADPEADIFSSLHNPAKKEDQP